MSSNRQESRPGPRWRRRHHRGCAHHGQGPKGELSHTVKSPISIERNESGEIVVSRPNDERESRSLHGLTRTLINNMVIGVTQGYEKEARDRRHRLPRGGEGLGPRVRARLLPPRRRQAPAGITFALEGPTKFSVSGISKQQVGRGRREHPQASQAGAVQGQGRALRRRAGSPQVGKAGK
jgi:large subunit ribosomal protein L6